MFVMQTVSFHVMHKLRHTGVVYEAHDFADTLLLSASSSGEPGFTADTVYAAAAAVNVKNWSSHISPVSHSG